MMYRLFFILLTFFCFHVGPVNGMDKTTATVNDVAFNNIKTICNRIATNGIITPEIQTLFIKKRDNGTLPQKPLKEYYNHCIQQLEPVLNNEAHRHHQFAVVCTHALLNNMDTDPEYSCKLLCYAITQKNIGLFMAILSHLNFKNLPILGNDATILHLCAQYNFTAGARLLFKNNKRSALILCVDRDGKTPLDWATDYNSIECMHYLKKVVSNKAITPADPIPAPTTTPTITSPPNAIDHAANNSVPTAHDGSVTINAQNYLGNNPLLWMAGLLLCAAALYGIWNYLKKEEKYDDEDAYDA